eukprot:Pgem_evm1s19843
MFQRKKQLQNRHAIARVTSLGCVREKNNIKENGNRPSSATAGSLSKSCEELMFLNTERRSIDNFTDNGSKTKYANSKIIKELITEIEKQQEYNKNEKVSIMETIEGIFNIESIMSWLEVIPESEKFHMMPVSESNRIIIQNICRLKYLYDKYFQRDDNTVISTEEDMNKKLLEPVDVDSEIPRFQIFSYLYRFNRYTNAEFTSSSNLLNIERHVKQNLCEKEMELSSRFQLNNLPAYHSVHASIHKQLPLSTKLDSNRNGCCSQVLSYNNNNGLSRPLTQTYD